MRRYEFAGEEGNRERTNEARKKNPAGEVPSEGGGFDPEIARKDNRNADQGKLQPKVDAQKNDGGKRRSNPGKP
jgi:hypothetical protein